MKVKVKAGWLARTLEDIAEKDRKEGEYARIGAAKGGIFSEKEYTPMERTEYLLLMMKYWPWSDAVGIFSTVELLGGDVFVEVDGELIVKINAHYGF